MTGSHTGRRTVAIVGTVGVPANYGGFETLVENIAKQHASKGVACDLVIYCSTKAYPTRPERYLGAQLRYVGLDANGVQSVLYDAACLYSAIRRGADTILVLGVSGAVCIPLARALARVRIVTNIDGIEWRRAKWTGLARRFLRFSERLAVRYSHSVIADNEAIADHVREQYGVAARTIAYGGDHALAADAASIVHLQLPSRYALCICRIEPENNIHLILEAFSRLPDRALVLVGNWDNSDYGRALRDRYGSLANIRLLDAIYDAGVLKSLRAGASEYVHGHSAGGTNPSLVEIMHFGIPVLAFDCAYNRKTTADLAFYFKDVAQLKELLSSPEHERRLGSGRAPQALAQERYTWNAIADQYFAELNVGRFSRADVRHVS